MEECFGPDKPINAADFWASLGEDFHRIEISCSRAKCTVLAVLIFLTNDEFIDT